MRLNSNNWRKEIKELEDICLETKKNRSFFSRKTKDRETGSRKRKAKPDTEKTGFFKRIFKTSWFQYFVSVRVFLLVLRFPTNKKKILLGQLEALNLLGLGGCSHVCGWRCGGCGILPVTAWVFLLISHKLRKSPSAPSAVSEGSLTWLVFKSSPGHYLVHIVNNHPNFKNTLLKCWEKKLFNTNKTNIWNKRYQYKA